MPDNNGDGDDEHAEEPNKTSWEWDTASELRAVLYAFGRAKPTRQNELYSIPHDFKELLSVRTKRFVHGRKWMAMTQKKIKALPVQ